VFCSFIFFSLTVSKTLVLMNYDTVFHILSNGERIIRRFTNHSLSRCTKTATILTTDRLLIRSKRTVCCYYHESSYTAVALESIDKINESHAHTHTSLCIIVWIFGFLVFIAGILVSIFLSVNHTIKIIGITLAVMSFVLMTIIIFTSTFCCFREKMIRLTGSFGRVNLVMEKNQARLFERNLSEQIYQAKMRFRSLTIPKFHFENETWKSNSQMITSSRFWTDQIWFGFLCFYILLTMNCKIARKKKTGNKAATEWMTKRKWWIIIIIIIIIVRKMKQKHTQTHTSSLPFVCFSPTLSLSSK